MTDTPDTSALSTDAVDKAKTVYNADTPDTSRERVAYAELWEDDEYVVVVRGEGVMGMTCSKADAHAVVRWIERGGLNDARKSLLARAEAAERRLGALREPGGFCTFCGRPQRLHAGQSCGGTPVYDAVTGEVL